MKLITFTPYAREGHTYFEAVAECMALLGPDDAAVIMDHDILHSTPQWYAIILRHLEMGMQFGTCLTNRVGCPWQVDPNAPATNDDHDHYLHGHAMMQSDAGLATDVTREQLMSGHLYVITRAAWDSAMVDTSGAPATVLEVDNYIHQKLRDAGTRLMLMNDLYVYHRYRFGNNDSKAHLQQPTPVRQVCYTVITGDYDQLHEPDYITPGWEYHVYHDGRLTTPKGSIWQPFVLSNPNNLTPALLSRRTKAICPVLRPRGQKLVTVYVDGNQIPTGDLGLFLKQAEHDRGERCTLIDKTHPERTDVWQEAEAVIRLKKADSIAVVRAMAKVSEMGVPLDILSETGILIRKYLCDDVEDDLTTAMQTWWEMVRTTCHRDQLTFNCAVDELWSFGNMSGRIFDKYFRKVQHIDAAIEPRQMPMPVTQEDRADRYPLTVFTTADARYAEFAPLFAASVLWSNPEARVEIVIPEGCPVPDMLPIITRWPDRLVMRKHQWLQNEDMANYGTYRWLIEPMLRSKYLYISDIDIITLQNIMDLHLGKMKEWGLPYSNMVRTGTKRMSGLHFTEYDALHPHRWALPTANISNRNDEEVLFDIVTGHGHALPPEHYRPVPGIHMSPNREPWPQEVNDRIIPGWGIEEHAERFSAFRDTDMYRELYQMQPQMVLNCLATVEEIVDAPIF